MKILSFNINGINSFTDYIKQKYNVNLNSYLKDILKVDIACFQEMKTSNKQITSFSTMTDYMTFTNLNKERNGIYGVSTFVRKTLYCKKHEINVPYSKEGRTILTDHGTFKILNIYFPFYDENGNKEKEDVINFYKNIKIFIEKFDDLIICGDFNAVYSPFDHYIYLKEFFLRENKVSYCKLKDKDDDTIYDNTIYELPNDKYKDDNTIYESPNDIIKDKDDNTIYESPNELPNDKDDKINDNNFFIDNEYFKRVVNLMSCSLRHNEIVNKSKILNQMKNIYEKKLKFKNKFAFYFKNFINLYLEGKSRYFDFIYDSIKDLELPDSEEDFVKFRENLIEKRYSSKLELSYLLNNKQEVVGLMFSTYQRLWLLKLVLEMNYIDVFRLYSSEYHRYTCWNTLLNLRPTNQGTRIDYIFVPSKLLKYATGSGVLNEIYGSDHCPIYLNFNYEAKGEDKNILNSKNNLLAFFNHKKIKKDESS